jgi:hypothetical protein
LCVLVVTSLGVFMIIALVGDENSNSDTLDLRFCLLGDVDINGLLGVALRVGLLLLKEMASGSGLES